MDVEVAEVARKAAPPARISKAALRRLARDAGARASKDLSDEGAAVLSTFLESLVERSVEAMRFARKRSVALSHVAYAAQTLGATVPAEVLEAAAADFKLSRCNARAPAGARKASALETEISCASFARVAKALVLKREAPPRLTVQARKLMHVLAELKVMEAFGRPTVEGIERRDPAERALASAFGCDAALAQELARSLAAVCSRVPELLNISATKTMDLRVLAAASGLAAPQGPLPTARDPAVKIAERMLRGCAVDRRLIAGGGAFLVAALREKHGLEAPPLPPRRVFRRRAAAQDVEAAPSAAMEAEPAATNAADSPPSAAPPV